MLRVMDPLKTNDRDGLLLETIVSTATCRATSDPIAAAGFEEIDVTVLKWLAAGARQASVLF